MLSRMSSPKARAKEKAMAPYLDKVPVGFRLGTLCAYEHRFMDSEFSLRYAQNNNCVECSRITIRIHRLLKSLDKLTKGKHDFLTRKYRMRTDPDLILAEIERIRAEKGPTPRTRQTQFWGPACPNGHADPVTSKCLRYTAGKQECVECVKDKAQKRRERKKELAAQKAAALLNPELAAALAPKELPKKTMEQIRAEYLAAQQELKRLEILERRSAR